MGTKNNTALNSMYIFETKKFFNANNYIKMKHFLLKSWRKSVKIFLSNK